MAGDVDLHGQRLVERGESADIMANATAGTEHGNVQFGTGLQTYCRLSRPSRLFVFELSVAIDVGRRQVDTMVVNGKRLSGRSAVNSEARLMFSSRQK